MDIYSILSSKPHNEHYLKRYWKFINFCGTKNENLPTDSYTEDHHICPKAGDLFPQYISFTKYPWNKIILTGRQHYIAHWLLRKAFSGSQIDAFWLTSHTMNNKTEIKISSKVYEQLKTEKRKKQAKLLKNLHENTDFGIKARKASEELNKRRTESGEASSCMKNNWNHGSIREKQKEYRESEKGKEHFKKLISAGLRFSKTKERSDISSKNMLKIHNSQKLDITCPNCGIIIKKIFGNVERHMQRCMRENNSNKMETQ